MPRWQSGPNCSNCGQTTLLISEAQVSKLLMSAGVSNEDQAQAPKTAYRCSNCQQVSCLQCAFDMGNSLKVSLPACPSCQSTQMVTLASAVPTKAVSAKNDPGYTTSTKIMLAVLALVVVLGIIAAVMASVNP